MIKTIRRGIKFRLADMNTSVRSTARSANIAAQTIHGFLNENTDIRISTLLKYCEYGLDCPLDEIIDLGIGKDIGKEYK